MTTPRVSATMLSARRHVEGRRGMPGMIPRGARGPGARREGEAHGASARAGARRARQGGRGAGRVPQVRRDAPRVRGARRGRVAGAVPRVLRPRPLAQGHGPARAPRARGGRLGEPRRARVRGRDAQGAREGQRGVPGHVPARAHGAQRGRGPRPCAVREGTAVSCQVDGTRPDESPAGRRPGSAAVLPREPHRCGAVRERGMPDPEACAAGGGASSAWRTRCTRGPRASWRASGGSRRGGSATTPAGSCGTSGRGGRTPTGRTPCRARRRRGATTTRGSPSRGSCSPSGPTGRISWPCQRWSNRELTVYSSLKQQALNTSEAAYRDKLKD